MTWAIRVAPASSIASRAYGHRVVVPGPQGDMRHDRVGRGAEPIGSVGPSLPDTLGKPCLLASGRFGGGVQRQQQLIGARRPVVDVERELGRLEQVDVPLRDLVEQLGGEAGGGGDHDAVSELADRVDVPARHGRSFSSCLELLESNARIGSSTR